MRGSKMRKLNRRNKENKSTVKSTVIDTTKGQLNIGELKKTTIESGDFIYHIKADNNRLYVECKSEFSSIVLIQPSDTNTAMLVCVPLHKLGDLNLNYRAK